MYSNSTLRERFTDGGLTTASGPKIVQLCYDRLDRDLAGALDALETREASRAHELLCHAQDILHELLGMLDLNAWEHAPSLAAIYRYVIDVLVAANIRKEARGVSEARRLLAELGDAFRQAAATTTAPTRAAFAASGDARERAFSVRA